MAGWVQRSLAWFGLSVWLVATLESAVHHVLHVVRCRCIPCKAPCIRRALCNSHTALAHRAPCRTIFVYRAFSCNVHRAAPFSVGALIEQPNPNVFCRAPFHDNHASGGWDSHIIIISTSLLTSYTHTIPHCCKMAPPAPASFTLVHIRQHWFRIRLHSFT